MKKLLIVFIVVFLLFACGELPGKYHIHYYGNGGAGYPPTDNNEYTSGSYATVLGKGTLKRTNFTFGGWNTKQDYSGKHYNEGDQIEIKNINIFLFVVWEWNQKIFNKYRIIPKYRGRFVIKENDFMIKWIIKHAHNKTNKPQVKND